MMTISLDIDCNDEESGASPFPTIYVIELNNYEAIQRWLEGGMTNKEKEDTIIQAILRYQSLHSQYK